MRRLNGAYLPPGGPVLRNIGEIFVYLAEGLVAGAFEVIRSQQARIEELEEARAAGAGERRG
jgi:hypothetical protein